MTGAASAIRDHTPQPLLLSMMVDGFFQQQMAGIMGPGVRRDDVSNCFS
jgi:hypothetical protein